MKQEKTHKFVYTTLFSALIFIGTQFIHIPLPYGYFNCGDCFILLSPYLLDYPYCMLAAMIGSVSADLLSGYVIYVPATCIIKACMTLIMVVVLKKHNSTNKLLLHILSACIAEIIMVIGYFLYDFMLFHIGAALTSLSGNILQAIVAIILSSFLYLRIQKQKIL